MRKKSVAAFLIAGGITTGFLILNTYYFAAIERNEKSEVDHPALLEDQVIISKASQTVLHTDNNQDTSPKTFQQNTNDPFVSFISILNGGSERDIPRLIELYEALEEGPEKYAAVFSLLKFWAKSDPDAAMLYGLSVKVKERDKAKLYEDIYGEIAKRNPALIIPVIEAVESAQEKGELLEMWLKDACRNHPDSVLNYVGNFSEFDTRQSAAAFAIKEVSKEDPELAGLNYSKLIQDTETKISVLPEIIKGYYRSPEDSGLRLEQWMINNLTTKSEQDTAASIMVSLLISSDLDGAMEWLNKIDDDAIYQSAVQEIEKMYSKKKLPADPEP